jgi:hypothetical protein
LFIITKTFFDNAIAILTKIIYNYVMQLRFLCIITITKLLLKI